MKTVAFFNNKTGTGTTTLAYHLAWMFQELGVRTVAVDLDPQADLTAMFLPMEDRGAVLVGGERSATSYNFLEALVAGPDEVRQLPLYEIERHLTLVPGDLALSRFEDRLAEVWGECLDSKEAAFNATSAFSRLAASAAEERKADLVLLDLGPSLGALNRAALIASDHMVIPLATDLYSIQALRIVGPMLSRWREQWQDRIQRGPRGLSPPPGLMQAAGYILSQRTSREGLWADRIPPIYHHEILNRAEGTPLPDPDLHRLASLKYYPSLMPLAQDARKPMFSLRAADGALGVHAQAVQSCHRDFETLARRIAARVEVNIPSADP